ncbi:hypothetical protein Goshw_009558 [Gossypium schwendimanii]|uniref:Uncharacterized protein n=1 Tax=Gossypium schwendimanii TaxID=34291 RepID=A0A7J9L902_GOSSC|nr:hypothetical protein [Gossypium schwendimanii]
MFSELTASIVDIEIQQGRCMDERMMVVAKAGSPSQGRESKVGLVDDFPRFAVSWLAAQVSSRLATCLYTDRDKTTKILSKERKDQRAASSFTVSHSSKDKMRAPLTTSQISVHSLR